ncbi:osmoprotectant update ABC transporter permease/substrate-binding subunit OpuFB [Neobacillus cucumis]|uniref:osmoprotectant update ABC transporter permease/substrate-binding subunit OpuFB n=1 Tax=Neobacillus cucumis TaxID=1740721 RepID=UPI002E1C5187|nr:osmoprotectant update ABC transporter permease/substrate-binding subunit OpuFB [Neobacillus cucumis]MED4227835.1 osmoprotectant update ABC transporter permease/substrate-binding subunit OpuFB [Neobacillus cucumis]
MNDLISVFSERKSQLLTALLQHIEISLIALFFSLIIAIPLGIYLTRRQKTAEYIIGITGVLQTIPSLALLGLLIPLFGIGTVPAVIALIAYALLPLLRNTYTGIKEVEPSLLEAASAMGMNRRKRLLKVELPLAMPVIMAGIRTATIFIIGTATIASLIGAGGLGDIILLGISRNDYSLIVLGAVPSALLAIIFDLLLRRLERISFKKIMVASGVFTLVTVLIVGFMIGPTFLPKEQKQIVISGKFGPEPEILDNMYKLLIVENTDLKVKLRTGLGDTTFVFNALKSKDVDVYPEFSGTAIVNFLKENPVSTNSKEVYTQAKEGMAKKYNMAMLSPMKFNDTYAIAVPEDFAKKYDLKKISDLVKVEQYITAGFDPEFADIKDGYPGLAKKYGLNFKIVTMDPSVRYHAIETGKVNLMNAYSTDGELQKYHLVVLEDDKHFFPPYQGSPLLRQETIDKYPEIVPALDKLAGKITDRQMQKMNYEVGVKGKKAEEVARDFLTKEGLLEK